jgi:glycosyltransferase involved in cell wall biosynthesis
MVRVLCLTTLPTEGPSNRLRVEQYAAPLRAHGLDLVVSPFFDAATYRILYQPGHTLAKAVGVVRGGFRRIRDAARVGKFDVVLVHRESSPLGPPLFERLLARRRIPYVFDFDDALFLGPVHPSNRRWSWLRHPSRVGEAVHGAAAIVTVNEYLATWARGYNEDVTIIPTPVDVHRFRPRGRPGRDGPIVLGWTGSSTTADYLRLLDEPLAALATRADVVLRVIGGQYRHSTVPVDVRPFSLATEADDLADIDIGLLPEPDDAWTRGKGAYKALLYMAMGIPVVASRVGVNEQFIADGGICVDNSEEWVDAIMRLVHDPELRARYGVAGRSRMESTFGLHVQVPRLAEVLLRASRTRGPN